MLAEATSDTGIEEAKRTKTDEAVKQQQHAGNKCEQMDYVQKKMGLLTLSMTGDLTIVITVITKDVISNPEFQRVIVPWGRLPLHPLTRVASALCWGRLCEGLTVVGPAGFVVGWSRLRLSVAILAIPTLSLLSAPPPMASETVGV